MKFVVSLLFSFLVFNQGTSGRTGRSDDGLEEWGYVEVRPRAHLFWWFYRSPYRVEDSTKPWPIVLWMQGGPGTSGIGCGDFLEIGPLDVNLKSRNSTWLQKADLLFVDNPVGTGYSYVEDAELLVKTEEEAAIDMTKLLEEIFNRNESLQKSPLYVVAESYGGRFAVTLGLAALKAIEAGKLKLKLGGVALGNSLISPLSWGPLLKDVSRLDDNGLKISNSIAQQINQQISEGRYLYAWNSWNELIEVIRASSDYVDFYNFLLDSSMDPLFPKERGSSARIAMNRYSRYLSSVSPEDIVILMNGEIRKKLKIIPSNVIWVRKALDVNSVLAGDFMRSRINEVDELLQKGINVTVYNGQLDVTSSTRDAEAWIKKLKWEGIQSFLSMDRTPLYCGEEMITKGFTKSYKNLHFYWILGAGHFVPVDQPCIALDMVAVITQSPAA